jgi:hypothetical protein
VVETNNGTIMPYIYMKSERGKITSFYTKNKAIKVGNVFTQNIFENFEGGTVIKVKFTKRDSI